MRLIKTTLLFFAILGMLPAIANKLDTPYPPEAFFDRPSIDGVRISPDGKHLAVRAKINGSKNILIIEKDTNKRVYSFNFASDDNEVGSFGWFNNERIYAQMNTKVGPLDQAARTGFLFAGNIDGKKKIKLLPKKNDLPLGFSILDELKDDPKHILIQVGKFKSSQREVYRMNVYNGKKKLLEKGYKRYNGYDVDHNASVRIMTAAQETDNLEFIVTTYYRDNEDSEWKEIYSINYEKGSYSVISFTPDNKNFYVYINDDDFARGIYLHDTTTGKHTLIHALKGDQDIEGYIYDEPSKQLIGITREKGILTKEYFEGFDKIVNQHKALDKAFPGQFVRILNHTHDYNTALLSIQSDKNPGQFFTYDKSKGDIKYLMKIRDKLSAKNMAERKPISFIARDGLEIRGILTLPNHAKKDLPLVVLVHGGPYGPYDKWLFADGGSLESQFLANNGYAVLQVNYRGSGGRGNDFQYDHYRMMGSTMQDDLTDATLWAVEQGYADKNRLCMYGASYGGYASLMAAVKEPELYQCVIGYAGVYDIAVQANDSDTRNSESGRKFLVDAWNAYDEAFVKKNSAVYHVDKIKAAVFLAHGTSDKRTPIGNYTRMSEALDKINYPYEKMVKEDEGHGFYTVENQVDFYSKMLKFLNKHIGK